MSWEGTGKKGKEGKETNVKFLFRISVYFQMELLTNTEGYLHNRPTYAHQQAQTW